MALWIGEAFTRVGTAMQRARDSNRFYWVGEGNSYEPLNSMGVLVADGQIPLELAMKSIQEPAENQSWRYWYKPITADFPLSRQALEPYAVVLFKLKEQMYEQGFLKRVRGYHIANATVSLDMLLDLEPDLD